MTIQCLPRALHQWENETKPMQKGGEAHAKLITGRHPYKAPSPHRQTRAAYIPLPVVLLTSAATQPLLCFPLRSKTPLQTKRPPQKK